MAILNPLMVNYCLFIYFWFGNKLSNSVISAPFLYLVAQQIHVKKNMLRESYVLAAIWNGNLKTKWKKVLRLANSWEIISCAVFSEFLVCSHHLYKCAGLQCGCLDHLPAGKLPILSPDSLALTDKCCSIFCGFFVHFLPSIVIFWYILVIFMSFQN